MKKGIAIKAIAAVVAFTIGIMAFAACSGVYTVTFEVNGNEKIETVRVEAGKSINLPDVMREGSIFEGWYDNPGFDGDHLASPFTPTKDITLYAKWRVKGTENPPGEEKSVTITFVTNGGEPISAITANSGTDLYLPAPERFGYEFDCWCTDEKLDEPFTSEKMPKADLTLYAKWRAEATTPDEHFIFTEIKDDNGDVTAYGITCESVPDNNKIKIPSEHNGKPVTVINDAAFASKDGLKSVIIPDGVTTIGDRAFNSCSDLKNISVPDSVTSIGSQALLSCYDLEYNELDNGLYLGNETNKYTVLVKAKSLGITSCTISDDTKIIFAGAFYNCRNIAGLTIPGGVKSVGNSAFYGCKGFTGMTIPGNVESIGDAAFYDCAGIKSISIESGVKSIGDSAFYGCVELRSLTIPDSITSMGNLVFAKCDKLEYNEYDNGLYLGDRSNGHVVLVKAKSTDITSCRVNADTKFVYNYAFTSCTGLKRVVYEGDIAGWCGITGLYNLRPGNQTLIIGGKEITGELVIPDNVTSIGGNAFSGCKGLTSVTIPDSVTYIGGAAFSNCTELTSIEIPDSVTGMGTNVFSLCPKLTSVKLPKGLTRIEYHSFYSCIGLGSIEIPDGVKSIGDSAFYYCTGLTSVDLPGSVTSIERSAFEGCNKLAEINFDGTVEQWNSVDKSDDWDDGAGSYVVHCTNGDVTK